MLVAPNLRGDDVSELQATFSRIGFDCGRVDGIFGPATGRALEDFQRNSGLVVDGVCGPRTVKAIKVLARQTGTGPGVSAVRELETLTALSRTLADLRVVVGQFGGLSSLARQVVQALRLRSATVAATDETDPAAQAAASNRFAAHVYVGFEADPAGASTLHYYAVPQFESAGGRSLAASIAGEWRRALPDDAVEVAGMRLAVLRETRMPAVLVTLGDVQYALDHAPQLVAAVVSGLERWAGRPSPQVDPAIGATLEP
jgi:N-acetylmuramoyl-L-alanine amidase